MGTSACVKPSLGRAKCFCCQEIIRKGLPQLTVTGDGGSVSIHAAESDCREIRNDLAAMRTGTVNPTSRECVRPGSGKACCPMCQKTIQQGVPQVCMETGSGRKFTSARVHIDPSTCAPLAAGIQRVRSAPVLSR